MGCDVSDVYDVTLEGGSSGRRTIEGSGLARMSADKFRCIHVAVGGAQSKGVDFPFFPSFLAEKPE